MHIEYYDFSSRSESFETITATGENIKDICIDICRQENMNFRLCENVYISPTLVEKNADVLFDAINSVQMPLAVNLWCFNGEIIPENTNKELLSTRLYNLSMSKNKIEGVIAVYDRLPDNNGAVILSENKIVRYIDDIEWNVLNVITGDAENISLQIEEENMYAKLKNCNVYFSGEKEIVLNFSAFLADYKGVSNGILYENSFKERIETEIENTIYQLYSDVNMVSAFNLYWYENQRQVKTDNITVNVTIL